MTHEIVLHELPRRRHRLEYLGSVLIETSDDPAFDACRALLARGITAKLQTRHAGAVHASLRVDIERGARLRTDENGRRFRKWEDPSEMAARRWRGSEKTAICDEPVPGGPKTEIGLYASTVQEEMA